MLRGTLLFAFYQSIASALRRTLLMGMLRGLRAVSYRHLLQNDNNKARTSINAWRWLTSSSRYSIRFFDEDDGDVSIPAHAAVSYDGAAACYAGRMRLAPKDPRARHVAELVPGAPAAAPPSRG